MEYFLTQSGNFGVEWNPDLTLTVNIVLITEFATYIILGSFQALSLLQCTTVHIVNGSQTPRWHCPSVCLLHAGAETRQCMLSAGSAISEIFTQSLGNKPKL